MLVDVLVKRKKTQVAQQHEAEKLWPAVEWAHAQQPLGMPLLWTAEHQMWPNLHSITVTGTLNLPHTSTTFSGKMGAVFSAILAVTIHASLLWRLVLADL